MALQWSVSMLAIALVVILAAGRLEGSRVRIQTPYGTVQGVRNPAPDGTYVDSFLGIPYAKPPVGPLRFRGPEPPDTWSGERDATQAGDQCPQQPFTGVPGIISPESEDCLHLHIYTPKVNSSRSLLPVMVWIHGGGFTTGTGNNYNGFFLARKGVVVVSINYRLDALGFLSTEDDVSPGNYGLMDQIRALEWVRDAISAFHGDPNDVTIFGESAGGASVSMLMLARKADGLFHKAILQSGSALCPWAFATDGSTRDPSEATRSVAQLVGCGASNDSADIVACLRNKDAMEIRNASIQLTTPFRPVFEPTFGVETGVFADTAANLLRRGLFSRVPTMRGYTSEEAGYYVVDPDNDGYSMQEYDGWLTYVMSDTFSGRGVNLTEPTSLVNDTYLSNFNVTDPFQLRNATLQYNSDIGFVGPILRELEMISRVSRERHYLYRFSFRSPNSYLPKWRGVVHAGELPYVFGMPFVPTDTPIPFFSVTGWADEDRQVAEHVMTMWTNFAKYGSPSLPESETWRYVADSPVYLDISSVKPTTSKPLTITPHLRLWTHAMPYFQRVNEQSALSSVLTTTRYGTLRGVRTTFGDGFHFDTYHAIPFAKPPIGDLRFSKPQEPDSWPGEREAAEIGPRCPQSALYAPPESQDEDCLHLSVYTPKMHNATERLPVMVWIHGGGYTVGSGVDYDGRELVRQGVVVVSVNYRLDALGFLCTEDDVSPGNYGLMDQIRALEWVRDVISAFNGDPNDVTIFGESAGAGSVSQLLLARGAEGLFHKAILQSGSALAPWAFVGPGHYKDPSDKAHTLAALLGCGASNASSALLACLRTKDAAAIMNASVSMTNPFVPVYESTFGVESGVFADTPVNLLRRALFAKVPTFRGFTSHEMSSFLNDTVSMEYFNFGTRAILEENFSGPGINVTLLTQLITEPYLQGVNTQDEQQIALTLLDLLNDAFFIAPTWRELEMTRMVSDSPQYLYKFSYRSVYNMLPEWKGAVHTAEISYVFGQPWSTGTVLSPLQFVFQFDDRDRLVSDRMMAMWTNFAKHGKPLPASREDWMWRPETPSLLHITNSTYVERRPQAASSHLSVWTQTVPWYKRVSGRSEVSTVVTQTRYGTLRGLKTTTSDGFYVESYLGIPYAKPPVGSLRFRKPEQPESWTGERNATVTGPVCPQPSPEYQSEDCLHLNVYKPKVYDTNTRLPVMVWIHGGSFVIGTGNNYDGRELTRRGVVVVTINYRLGPLGFLSTEDENSPGNYGLMDQIRALEWVRDVISDFHGDPNDVTIFGMSAGAASVSWLLLVKHAEGLFHKAIMQSGSSLAPWASTYPDYFLDPSQKARALSEKLGCGTHDDFAPIVACLRTKNVTDIVKATLTLAHPYMPVVESSFGVKSGLFPDTPENLLKRGMFSKVPTLRGFNANESSYFVEDPDNDGISIFEFRDKVEEKVKEVLFTPNLNVESVKSLILKTYLSDVNLRDAIQLRQTYIQLESDMEFIGPMWREMELWDKASNASSYVYRFSHRSVNSLLPKWKGAMHVAETQYVFGQPWSPEATLTPVTLVLNYTEEDREVAERLVTMWTNFAKHGTPTLAPKEDWSWTSSRPMFVDLGNSSTWQQGAGSASPHMYLWTSTLPKLQSGEILVAAGAILSPWGKMECLVLAMLTCYLSWRGH